jgi:hypothetical protein
MATAFPLDAALTGGIFDVTMWAAILTANGQEESDA